MGRSSAAAKAARSTQIAGKTRKGTFRGKKVDLGTIPESRTARKALLSGTISNKLIYFVAYRAFSFWNRRSQSFPSRLFCQNHPCSWFWEVGGGTKKAGSSASQGSPPPFGRVPAPASLPRPLGTHTAHAPALKRPAVHALSDTTEQCDKSPFPKHIPTI